MGPPQYSTIEHGTHEGHNPVKPEPNVSHRQIQTTGYVVNPIAIAIAVAVANAIAIAIVEVPCENAGNRFFYNGPTGSEV